MIRRVSDLNVLLEMKGYRGTVVLFLLGFILAVIGLYGIRYQGVFWGAEYHSLANAGEYAVAFSLPSCMLLASYSLMILGVALLPLPFSKRLSIGCCVLVLLVLSVVIYGRSAGRIYTEEIWKNQMRRSLENKK